MSLWLFMVLVTRPVIAAIPALSLQGAFLVIEVLAVAFRVAAMFVGYSLQNSELGGCDRI